MRMTWIYILFAAVAAMAAAALQDSSAPAIAASADKPDLIVLYSGDVQGYLEECG